MALPNLDYQDDVECAHCNKPYLHPVRTYLHIGQDGDAPYFTYEAKEVRVNGSRNINVSQCESSVLTGFNTSNRTREIDTHMLFQCENCHKHSALSLTFHKGRVAMHYLAVESIGRPDFMEGLINE